MNPATAPLFAANSQDYEGVFRQTANVVVCPAVRVLFDPNYPNEAPIAELKEAATACRRATQRV
jgi:hypothetical protein